MSRCGRRKSSHLSFVLLRHYRTALVLVSTAPAIGPGRNDNRFLQGLWHHRCPPPRCGPRTVWPLQGKLFYLRRLSDVRHLIVTPLLIPARCHMRGTGWQTRTQRSETAGRDIPPCTRGESLLWVGRLSSPSTPRPKTYGPMVSTPAHLVWIDARLGLRERLTAPIGIVEIALAP